MTRPLKFLHFTTFYPPYSFGGDAIQVRRLAHALADEGHQVDVVHCIDSFHMFHPAPPEVEFPEHPNVTRHELRSVYGSLSPLLTQQTGRPWLKREKIAEILRLRSYDVVHFHNMSLLGPEVLSMVSQQSNAVKFYTAHEHWLICPTHVLWKFNREACTKPDCLRCTLHAKRPPQIWRYTGLLDRAARNVDLFLAPSRFTARIHAERGFRAPMAVLPHFVDDIGGKGPTESTRPNDEPYFLFVGRLELIKGLQTLIPLWDLTPGCDLLVAGTGSYEPELRSLAAGNPRIKFLGSMSQDRLGLFYEHALGCIVPSLTYETFGLISLEAFARRTPVIVRDLGALPEAVEQSGGGFIYRNDEELLEHIRRVASSPELRKAAGSDGYEAFRRLWSREAHLSRYLGLVNEIAERKSPQSSTAQV